MQRQRLPESASRISSSVGLGVAREQVGRRDDEARRAEAALHGARLDERLLHAVQPVAVGEALDRRHLVPVGLRGEHEARADERAVEQHRARAALALLARVLRAGEAELLAQREEQRLALPAVGLALVAVDAQRDPHAQHPLERARRSARAARAGGSAAVPRTSSIGAAAAATCSGNDVRLVARRGHEHGPRRRPSRTTRAARRPRETASETTAITIAFRGPTFMNVCGAPDGVSQHRGDQLVRRERVPLHAGDEVGERHAARAAHRRALDLGALDHERRQRVAGRRRGAEVAADRAAVADLRRADRARRLGERRQQLAPARRAIASV